MSLYIIATPIGNYSDISQHALAILQAVDLILAEDTRITKRLLQHFNISKPLLSFYDYNEQSRLKSLLPRLEQGESMALVSDAGTPLISDPGYALVKAAHSFNIKVIPIPGPCAAITALSVAGLPTHHFCFIGFLPSKKGERDNKLKALAIQKSTLIFYEAPHRLLDTLAAMQVNFGKERPIAFIRELTKSDETIILTTISKLITWLNKNQQHHYGEIVLVVAGQTKQADIDWLEAERVLQLLAAELPTAQAASLAAKILNIKKSILYQKLIDKT